MNSSAQQLFWKVKRTASLARLLVLFGVVGFIYYAHVSVYGTSAQQALQQQQQQQQQQHQQQQQVAKGGNVVFGESSIVFSSQQQDPLQRLEMLERENVDLKHQLDKLKSTVNAPIRDPTRRSLASHEQTGDDDADDDEELVAKAPSSATAPSTTELSPLSAAQVISELAQKNQELQSKLTVLEQHSASHQSIQQHQVAPGAKHTFDMDDEEAGSYIREQSLEETTASIRAYYASHVQSGKKGKVVLMTGAAGFIGFHTSTHMQNRGDFVLGLDNLNAYYDPKLKTARLTVLAENGVKVLRGDVCDADLLRTIFRAVPITHVVHLAAQAGVRFALEHPLAYIRANVKCFVTLLEVIKEFHTVQSPIKTVYASSSSVYGLNKKQPFNEKDQVDTQASLYGATKKADEEIAHVYHHVHKLPLTGLRFFTVYGPFGRPDMAYYSFTQAILAGKNITIYQNDDGSEMMRDFTYVSDIVEGITASMDLGADLEVFNLGNNHPEKLSKLISLVEKGLGKVAGKNYSPIIAGDVPVTFADVSHAKELLGYQPKVSLQDGLAKFLSWYSSFFNVNIPGLPSTSEAAL